MPKLNVRTRVAALSTAILTLALTAGAQAGERSAEGGVIVLASREGQAGIGAGTVVAKAGTHLRVLTAGHVATFGALQLRLASGAVVAARLVALVPGRDLAIIEADVARDDAAALAAAPVAQPRATEAIHVWGSGNDGPAYEVGTVGNVGALLPDGRPQGRYTLGCALCHRGDSGAGVFNARGELVGVYIGYFEIGSGRLSIAELPPPAGAAAGGQDLAFTGAAGSRGHGSGRDERRAVTEVAEGFAR